MFNQTPEKIYLTETAQLLSHDLEVDLHTNQQAWEQLRDALIVFLDTLIRTDSNRLYYYLYRIDVSEKRIKQTITDSPNQTLTAPLLADLILERTLEKVKTRLAYKQWQETQNPTNNHNEQADEW
ncbi:MAG: hypothetical protein KA783_02380 [Chitinophagales bacterium]|jgi:hypothetical protein|nr:hypothetical protein [Sphingobacteriales bacterium]MBP7533266.1 hypothetical protein [Chitinophagales bacterium]